MGTDQTRHSRSYRNGWGILSLQERQVQQTQKRSQSQPSPTQRKASENESQPTEISPHADNSNDTITAGAGSGSAAPRCEYEVGRVEALKKNFEDGPQASKEVESSPGLAIENPKGTEHDEQNIGKYYDAHGKAMKPPPQHTVNCSTDVASSPTPEATRQLSRFKSLDEEADYWHDLYQLLKDENGKLVDQNKKLYASRSKYKTRAENFQLSLADEKRRFVETTAKHQNDMDTLKSKVEGVKASYIKSVNSVGTGLDNITDEEFEPRLRALHYKVNAWSRKASKPRGQVCPPEQLHDVLLGKLTFRVSSIATLKFAQLVETVTWEYIENNIFSVWFPTLDRNETAHMTSLHQSISAGDRSSSHEKSEFWRAYTVSLLFQNSEVQRNLEQVEHEMQYILSHLHALQVDAPRLDDSAYESLRDLACYARNLAAEFRCQRAFYEIDQSIKLGVRYDPDTMEDVTFTADVDEDDEDEESQNHAVVSCIIARRLVRRPFPGSKDVAAQLSKAKVLVTVK